MSVEILGSGVWNEAAESIFAENYAQGEMSIDARRRLENKMEEMRLQKELSDFDFDI